MARRTRFARRDHRGFNNDVAVRLRIGRRGVSVGERSMFGGCVGCGVNSANGSGGGTINLAPRCDYALTTADNGENGLPVVTSRIAVNGNGATIDGTSSVRVFEVDGPGG